MQTTFLFANNSPLSSCVTDAVHTKCGTVMAFFHAALLFNTCGEIAKHYNYVIEIYCSRSNLSSINRQNVPDWALLVDK